MILRLSLRRNSRSDCLPSARLQADWSRAKRRVESASDRQRYSSEVHSQSHTQLFRKNMDVEMELSSVSTTENMIWEMNNDASPLPSDSGANGTTDPEDFIIDLRPIFRHFHCSWPLLSIFVLAFICHYSIGTTLVLISIRVC